MSSPKITLRPPSTSKSSSQSDFTPPPLPFLLGTWHVTHSTLPMWKTARNVQITYAEAPSSSEAGGIPTAKLDDKVTYQSLSSDKIKTISGIDSPAGLGAWNWRGKGWLMIASSHWEVLGFGGEDGADEGLRWVVTYFARTMFTPAGIDFYSRGKEGLSEAVVERLKSALREVDCEVVKGLAGEIFEVGR